ncbi:uncharacterized protein [Littorina saxatilis]|uniref:Uncharacterized protein n=1 Tax=Littorina saxatilis TaxID=31220 RepID=A0AAN9AJE4_9CAEN
MEACIEALYTIDGETDKRKTLEMIRVLKGCISLSKSRTGEVIYRYNRHEKKALSRAMAKYDKDLRRSRVNIDSQKRDVLHKWNLVFGRQRKFCESIRGFDEMLHEALETRYLYKFASDEDGAEEEKEDEAEEVQDEVVKMPQISDPRARRLGGRQSAPQGVVSTPVILGVLPKLGASSSLHNARIETEAEERERHERKAEEERKLKARELPRFDKELMETYLTEQKSLHEDLLTRNAIVKIKSSVDKDHVFFKYRLKTKLPDSASSLLHRIERERSMSVTTAMSGTRPSTRSRLSTRQGPRQKSSKSTMSSRSLKGEELEEVCAKLDKVVVTARDPSPTQSQLSLPRLERAKTVHFS